MVAQVAWSCRLAGDVNRSPVDPEVKSRKAYCFITSTIRSQDQRSKRLRLAKIRSHANSVSGRQRLASRAKRTASSLTSRRPEEAGSTEQSRTIHAPGENFSTGDEPGDEHVDVDAESPPRTAQVDIFPDHLSSSVASGTMRAQRRQQHSFRVGHYRRSRTLTSEDGAILASAFSVPKAIVKSTLDPFMPTVVELSVSDLHLLHICESASRLVVPG
jgi:hypothetical protein